MRLANTLLCLVLFIAILTSCNHNGNQDTLSGSASNQQSGQYSTASVTLPYSQKDVVNPYTAKTKQNQELSKLLYDPLVKLTPQYEPELFIASDITQNNETINVKLRTNIKFTDGSGLTADDVIYSLKQAKAEGSNYKDKLNNIVNYYAVDSYSMIIEIGYNDSHFVNNLDFPIIKASTADAKDENNLSLAPTGCGRYILKTDGDYHLTANTNYYRGVINLKKIGLVDCPDSDSMSRYMAIGKISFAYSDLSESDMPKLAGTTIKTFSSSLVYVGANSASSLFSDSRARLAVSYGLDRKAICNNAYFEFAQPATSLFPTEFSSINGLVSIDISQNAEQSVAYLNELGYNTFDNEGYLLNDNGKRLTISLLYNSDNSIREAAALQIAAQLKKCGIEVQLKGALFEQYKYELSVGRFDLYLGEVRLSNSLDALPLLSGTNSVYGVSAASPALTAFNSYYNGDTDILSAVSGFVSDMPFIPLCYRNGAVVCTSAIAQVLNYSPSDIFNGIETLK